VAIYDACSARLEAIGRTYNHLKLAGSLEQFLEHPIQAVAIATPVSTHFSLAERGLEAGLHVLVEKPMASTVHEAQVLIDLASLGGITTQSVGDPVRRRIPVDFPHKIHCGGL
jgi:predicted dehydrogenase